MALEIYNLRPKHRLPKRAYFFWLTTSSLCSWMFLIKAQFAADQQACLIAIALLKANYLNLDPYSVKVFQGISAPVTPPRPIPC